MRVRPALALALLPLVFGAGAVLAAEAGSVGVAIESVSAVAVETRSPSVSAAPAKQPPQMQSMERGTRARVRSAVRENALDLIKARIAALPAKDAMDAQAAASAAPAFAGARVENQPVVMATFLVEEREDPERIKREVDEAISSHNALASPALYKKDLTKKIRLEVGLPLGPGLALPFFRISW